MAYEIVAVGTSMGGLAALQTLVSDLPDDFAPAVAVVQHRSVESSDVMLQVLRRCTRLRVREPLDKEPIEGGTIYVAPVDYHLMVEDGAFTFTTEGAVTYARPSIDVLFDSVADAFGPRAIGVVLTGANHDGAAGAARIKDAGGVVVVQEPATAECPVMPKAVVAATRVDRVLPLGMIAPFLTALCARMEV